MICSGGIQPGFDQASRGPTSGRCHRTKRRGAGILCIDPHLSGGPSRFWSFAFTRDAAGSGFTLPGCPYIGLGHNANVAWR